MSAVRRRRRVTKRERQYRHILASLLGRGLSRKRAEAIAAATVNKYRAKLARGYFRCKKRRGRKICRRVRGPRLVTRGGSRNQWWPGKKRRRRALSA